MLMVVANHLTACGRPSHVAQAHTRHHAGLELVPDRRPRRIFRATHNPNIQKWVVLRQKIRYTVAAWRSRGPLGSRWPTHLFLVRIRGLNRVHPTEPKNFFASSSRSAGRTVDYIQIPIKPKISTRCECTLLRTLIQTTNKCAHWGHPRGPRKRPGATV